MEKTDLKKIMIPENAGTVLTDETVVCSRVIYNSGDFYIFAAEGGFTVKGKCTEAVVKGISYKVSGVISVYGLKAQIAADSITKIEDELNDSAVMTSFLSSCLDGVGEKLAGELAARYGEGCLDKLLKSPNTAASETPGLSMKKARTLSEYIDENEAELRRIYDLMKFGLTAEAASKAADALGAIGLEELKTNPFLLMRLPGFGFETCDKLSRKYNLDPLSTERFAAAVYTALTGLHMTSGSTYLTGFQTEKDAEKLLDCDVSKEIWDRSFIKGCEKLTADKRICIYRFNEEGKCENCSVTDEGARLSLSVMFRCEVNIKREVEAFVTAKKPEFNSSNAELLINDAADKLRLELNDKQREALLMCMSEPLSIITGGPGTGKTTITGILADHFKRNNIKCVFCAPTGRAAKRLSDAIGIRAYTIHKLLEIRGGDDISDDVVGKGPDDPIDARVVIVDEASMVDVRMFKSLLFAIKKNASLILIGDPNQLPSVGPGNLLSDLLSCRSIPRVQLEYIFRQDEESGIAMNAYRILNGQMPVPCKDFEMIEAKNDEEAREILIEKYRECCNEFGTGDTAILSPTKQNLLGTVMLNEYIQSNEIPDGTDSLKNGSGTLIYEGDRVMQIKNNYSLEFFDPDLCETGTGVFNGELGSITDIDEGADSCSVIFDDLKTVTYSKKDIGNLDLAYAMTVHKSQGCEFDNVIIALGKMNSLLYSRKLLYTAVTRGKKKIIIIDSAGALKKILNSKRENTRSTSLTDFLRLVDDRNEKKDTDIQ